MTDISEISPNLGLPFYQTKLNEFEVQHNEALLVLDALVMLAVIDRDLSAPPGSPAFGDRYLVKATGTGDFAGKDNRIAQYDVGGWNFYAPQPGWTCYVQDEHTLLAWDGDSWEPALDVLGGITEIQDLSLLGVGTTADATNPLSAKLNNVLWTAKTVAEGGDGDLRYKLSKESAAKTLSFLFQDNFSGRAEIGLTGDDDFHFKVSADGSSWVDALDLDKTTGAAKLNSAFYLTGDISPSQITADQNDYNPTGLSGASVLRLSTDAGRNLTGLAGGADGRVAAIVNAGSNNIVLKDANSSSSAANRFSFGADVTLAAKQSAVLWYDSTDSRWKLLAAPQASGGGGVSADLDIVMAELALGLADALNVAQFLGSAGNRFADSFDALTYVNTGGSTNLNSGTAGLLKPTVSGTTVTINSQSSTTSSNFTFIDRSTAVLNSVVVSKVGVYSATPLTFKLKIVKRNSANNYDVVVDQTFSHGGAGFEDCTLASPYTVPGTGTYYLGAYTATGTPNSTAGIARAYIASDLTGTGVATSGEDTGSAGYPLRYTHTFSPSNLSTKSTGLTAASAPSSMKVIASVNHVDSATAGTDYKFKVSRDGGSHLSGYLTLNNRFTIPGGSIHVIESDAIDVTGITTGTTPMWQFETFNNKNVELMGVYLYWT